MPISQRQQRYLLDRLQAASNAKPREYQEDPGYKPPANIVRAEKEIARLKAIVSAHDSRRTKARKFRNEKISDAYTIAKETILFGDEDKALAAVKAFETKKF